jgi:hypothetical protein
MAPIANLTVRLSAQIAEFQSEFREATRSAEKFQNEFGAVATKASAFGNLIAIGVTAAVAGLKTLAQSVLDNASNIVDLSQKTGLAISTIQEFQHAAEQTGTTVDAFANSSFELSKRLAGDSKSVVAAVSALGLSFRDLQSLSPDEQFKEIAIALGQVKDQNEFAAIGVALFGKSFKEIASAVREDYRKLAEEAVKTTDAQIRAVEQLGDAWDKFMRDLTTHATGAAGALVLAGKAIKEAGFLAVLKEGLIQGDPIRGALSVVTKGFIDVELAALKADKGTTKLSAGFQDLVKRLEENDKATKKSTASTDAYAKSVSALADKLSGADLATEVKKLADAFDRIGNAQRTPATIQRTADAALELFKAGAKLTPELFSIVIEAGKLTSLLPTVKAGFDGAALGVRDITAEVNAANQALIEMTEIMNSVKFTKGLKGLDLGDEIGSFTAKPPEPLPATFWDEFLDVDGPTLAQSARLAADNVIGALGNAIKTGDWAGFRSALRDSFSQFAGAAIAAGVNLLVPGLGTLLQPIFTGLASAFTKIFDRNKGRDAVEAFAEGFGGFDELHKQLNVLGEEGEELWKKLTQGVGRNNPQQAAQAIAEIEEALAKYKASQDAATISTEAGAQATIETAAQAALALDEVNAKLITNAAAWGDWSVQVTGYLQKLADDIRALPLPGPTGTMGGSTGGARPRVSFTGSGGGGTAVVPVGSLPSPESGSTTVILEMDSYQVAEAVVPQIPGVVQRYGLGAA